MALPSGVCVIMKRQMGGRGGEVKEEAEGEDIGEEADSDMAGARATWLMIVFVERRMDRLLMLKI